MRGYWRVLMIAAFGAALAVGCGKKNPPSPPAPAAVTVSRPIVRNVVQWDEYSGNLSSPDMANVEARVSGLILEAPFREGAIVNKGDLLFVIDPSPFQADLDAKKAAVAQAQAQAEAAEVHFRRFAAVAGTKAVSADDYDTAKAAYQEAEASLNAAKAALETSQLNLTWARVLAPISGRVGKQNVQVGNLVTGGAPNSTLLTTIAALDPLYCYVQVPAEAALRYEEMAGAEAGANITQAHIPCYVQVPGEPNFAHPGTIDFFGNTVNTGTGTVEIRGVIPNPTRVLLPGLNVRMRIPGSAPHQAVLIQDAAINAEQNERFVLVVGPDDAVTRQPVEPGPAFADLRAVQGINPDQRVVVNGVQKATPGQKVKPHEVPVPTQQLDAFEATGSGTPQTAPATAPGTTTRPGGAGQSGAATQPFARPAQVPQSQPATASGVEGGR